MRFHVRALDGSHARLLTLTLDALDEADVQAQLRARGLTLVGVVRAASWMLAADRRGRRFNLPLFAQELHALLQAGLGLVEGLEALVEKEKEAGTRAVLDRLLAALRDGKRLSSALRAQPGQFPGLLVGIVEAAENTGELASGLESYIAYDQRVQAVRQTLLSAAIYPVILLSVGGAVALFLMGWVVPRFASVYQGTGRTLPWGSQLLLEWGLFAGQHAAILLVPFVAGVAVAIAHLPRWLRQTDAIRLLAWIPGVQRWIELLTLSRLYLTLGLLLHGGLPIHPALALASSVMPSARRAALRQVGERIGEGQMLSAALEEGGLVTPIAVRFVRAGERSGQLAQMLNRAALYHDAETSRWVQRFSKTFEPLLMAAIGVVIGIIVLLLYMPIFDLAGSLR